MSDWEAAERILDNCECASQFQLPDGVREDFIRNIAAGLHPPSQPPASAEDRCECGSARREHSSGRAYDAHGQKKCVEFSPASQPPGEPEGWGSPRLVRLAFDKAIAGKCIEPGCGEPAPKPYCSRHDGHWSQPPGEGEREKCKPCAAGNVRWLKDGRWVHPFGNLGFRENRDVRQGGYATCTAPPPQSESGERRIGGRTREEWLDAIVRGAFSAPTKSHDECNRKMPGPDVARELVAAAFAPRPESGQ